ncbi:transcriptional regulator, IclR family [Halogeometricum rufum]|jgi:DNA-binding IclR family transcriptional regulator|uniref:Transcriptional regulator, IclR family n=1 Tax=Halogeometricum rufum TaxID=553469 RepID=A0A1I6II72_9EURY|nr:MULTISPECIES: IclR family transcriptional regulator [Halogeometricum]MUV57165.1 helix-turn-helix domain-containing protein [Halogeometricum sp. CBA1124]SFR66388.1 transcriptional regulator, IclR family [Halogeometricum rufum]
MRPRSTESDTLQTTDISLRLVELITELDGATLAELADEAGLAKSTVHNHLKTLAKYGYVSREEDTYHVGLKLYHLGNYARKRNEVYGVAKALVPELADETQLEVDFTVEENGRVVSLYDESTYSDTPSYLVDGRLFHVHSTASGKAILAEFPEHRVREILDQWGLSPQTEHTITSADEFVEELARVRERGYATNFEEAIEGMWAVSMPVKTPLGEVCGSINVCGPTYVHDESRERAVVDAMSEKVDEFERRLATQSG